MWVLYGFLIVISFLFFLIGLVISKMQKSFLNDNCESNIISTSFCKKEDKTIVIKTNDEIESLDLEVDEEIL